MLFSTGHTSQPCFSGKRTGKCEVVSTSHLYMWTEPNRLYIYIYEVEREQRMVRGGAEGRRVWDDVNINYVKVIFTYNILKIK